MNRSSNKKNLSALASLCIAAVLTTGSTTASAQSLVSNASPEELIQMLGGEVRPRMLNQRIFNYKPTPAPEAGTNKCPGVGGGWDAPPKSGARQNKLVVEGVSAADETEAPQPVYTEQTPGKVDLKITFVSGNDVLDEASKGLLNNLAVALNSPSLSTTLLAVAGHTDAEGNETEQGRRKNLELSCARGIAVRKYLTSLGVAPARLGVYGFGASKPIKQGVVKSETNRRVEIRRAS
jgi:outer membrane protein OmpA-like peptidoglycan-associated protein